MSETAGRPWVLAETTWQTVEQTSYDVAVLPWGATEAHNRHLPYGTDTVQSEHIAREAAGRAWQAGSRVVVLPAVPFGVQTGQLDIPLCLNMNPSTQAALLRDIVDSLEAQGIPRLVIINGHGGNDFRQIIRELQPRTRVLLCTLNWYQAVPASEHFDEPGDHGGELETSVMMHIAPTLVRPLADAGPGTARPFRVAAFREGWAWTPRHWRSATDDTGVGDPRRATPGKGERYVAAVTERIAEFLVELAGTPVDEMYG
jgi:creatinine amidohydrolase